VKSQLKEWATASLKGLQGGHPIMRLACAGGLLIGLDEVEITNYGWRKVAEDEIVVALAEIMDIFNAQSPGGWEKEFQPETETGEGALTVLSYCTQYLIFTTVDALSLAFILASQVLPLDADEELRALPLPVRLYSALQLYR
jgi:hypothetical protein